MQHSLMLPENKKIVLFDGVCNLCNSAVQIIIRNDKKDVFRFVALQSDLGLAIQNHIGIETRKIDSLVLYTPGISYSYKFEAVLDIAKELGGVFSLAIVFKILPTPLLNSIYDYVAKNRYKWYGNKNNCWIPTKELKNKFL